MAFAQKINRVYSDQLYQVLHQESTGDVRSESSQSDTAVLAAHSVGPSPWDPG